MAMPRCLPCLFGLATADDRAAAVAPFAEEIESSGVCFGSLVAGEVTRLRTGT